MSDNPYKRQYYDWPLERMAKTLKERLRLKGDPIALAWSMEPPEGLEPYRGALKLAHCQFMQRSRFLGETFVLTRENQSCTAGNFYCGFDPPLGLASGYVGGVPREDGVPGIFGSPGAQRRNFRHYYFLEQNTAEFFSCAPLSNCAFDPDIITVIGNVQTTLYAVRAAIYYSGMPVWGETGQGTCSTSWIAAYLTGQIRYTLGCFGAFRTMGLDSAEVTLSIPLESLRETCVALEEWKERGKLLFYELPPNEEREYMKVPYEGPYDWSVEGAVGRK